MTIFSPVHFISDWLYNPLEILKETAVFLDEKYADIVSTALFNGNTSIEFKKFFENKEINDDKLIHFYSQEAGCFYDSWADCMNKDRDMVILTFLLNNAHDSQILDFSGNVGTLSLLLASYGLNVVFSDLGRKLDFITFRQMKYNLKFPIMNSLNITGKFKAILCLEVMEHLFDLEKTLKELMTHLDSGGFFIYKDSCHDVGRIEHLQKNEKYGFGKIKEVLETLGLVNYGKLYWKTDVFANADGKLEAEVLVPIYINIMRKK